ncbi:MAG: hypothetical protein PF495_06135 [Spirochaetales bacterium]|jgi:hypothetical protein|nr:hypothetical protein [Spirochaetales bacterium]
MYYLVDVVLFLLTLFIIIVYRFIDRKDRQIHLVKTYLDRMKQELTNQENDMYTAFDQLAGDMERQEKSVRSMLKRVDQSLVDLETHAAELNQLQAYMSHYHRILKELSSLTEKAEKRLVLVQQEFDTLNEKRQELEQLSEKEQNLEKSVAQLNQELELHKASQIEALDARTVGEFKKHLDILLAKSEAKLNNSSMAFEREYDNAMESFQTRVERLLEEAGESIETQLAAALEQITEGRQTPGKPSNTKSSTRSEGWSERFVDWNGNGINREASAAAAVLCSEADKNQHSDVIENEKSRDPGISSEPDTPSDEDAAPDTLESEHVELFDMLDNEDETAEDEREAVSIMKHLKEHGEQDEEPSVFDEVEEHDFIDSEPSDLPVNKQDEDDAESDEEDDTELDDDELDRIYYEDEEEIVIEDEDSDDEFEPAVSPDKRRIIEEHLKEGFSTTEIEELTDIPKGEIELIKELLDYPG